MTNLPKTSEGLLEEDVEDLYQNAPCGYISTLPDGTILKLNHTLAHWLGYSEVDVVGVKKFQQLLTVGGRIYFETHFDPLLKMQGYLNEVALDLVAKDGTTIPILASSVQRHDADKKHTVNRTTLFNITDRKRYEKQLVFERKKAQQAAKDKADFLSMMSHEIRTPMNAVIGVAHLIESTDLSPQQEEYVRMLRSSSEHLMELLNSILDFSKLEAGKVEIKSCAFSIKELVHDSVQSLIAKAAQKKLELSYDVDDSIDYALLGDAVKLRQVLSNLISNAVKFTEEGHVRLFVREKSVTSSSAKIEISIEDTGIGIPEHQVSQIFNEFIQANEMIGANYGGSGLGLAISQKIVELMGGHIKVKSQEGKGSTFSFEIQVSKATQSSPEFQENLTPDDTLLKGLRVLIAEDSDDNVMILTRFFKRWNIEFEVARNGKEAIEFVKKASFDLLLTDLRMPVMGGLEASKIIKELLQEQGRTMPLLAFSASTMAHDRTYSGLDLFDDFLGKPFRPEELFTKIARLLNRYPAH